MHRMNETDRASLVYVVDDDDALRDSLVWLLESAGYSAEAFGSAEEFLAEYVPDTAACLVLDLRLPGMSGIELQQHLKHAGSALPIIFITGHGDSRTEADALKSGGCYFLHKPFLDERLLALVEQVVAKTASP